MVAIAASGIYFAFTMAMLGIAKFLAGPDERKSWPR